MKRIIFKVVFCLQIILLANNLFAQDVIVLKSGDEIKSKVLEVSTDQIKYKKWENIDGPDYSSLKSDVFMIKYQNGTKEVFKSQESSNTSIVPALSNDDKKNEAFESLRIFFKNRFNNDKVFLMLDLDKSNGVMKNLYGQSVYEIDYKLKLEFISDAWVKSFYGTVYFDKNFTTYDREPVINVFGTKTSNSYLFNKGKIYAFSGKATLENTDNGYILKDYDIKKVEYVGLYSNYTDINNSDNSNKNKESNNNVKLTITDVDSNIYSTVTIGTQVWMAENLKTTKYNDGSNIPYVASAFEWKNLKTPGYCWPSNDSTNRNNYGALYNWHTVKTKILCPTGWHIPTDSEWTLLTTNNGNKIFAGGELGGFRSNFSEFSSDIGRIGIWWSSTENSAVNAWVRFLNYGHILGRHGEYYKESGFSVRCVKD